MLYALHDTASIIGTAEARLDIFYVRTGNESSKLLQAYGEVFIYSFDFGQYSIHGAGRVNVSKITVVQDIGALDGISLDRGRG